MKHPSDVPPFKCSREDDTQVLNPGMDGVNWLMTPHQLRKLREIRKTDTAGARVYYDRLIGRVTPPRAKIRTETRNEG